MAVKNESTGWPEYPAAVATAGLVIAVIALRVGSLGGDPWLDERITLHFLAELSFVEQWVELPRVQPHLPLFYAIADVTHSLVGRSLLVLRGLSFVFGAVAIGLTYLLGAELADRRSGAIAAGLMAISPMQIMQSANIRPYALLTMLAALSILLLFRARRRDSWRTWGAWILSAVLLALTHYHAGLTIAALAVGILLVDRGTVLEKRRQLVAWGSLALLATPVALVVVWKITGTGGGWTPAQVSHTAAPSLSAVVLAPIATLVGPITPLAALLAAVWLGGVGLALRGDRTPAVGILMTAIVLPIVGAAVLSVTIHPVWGPRYMIAITPSAAVLGGAGLAGGAIHE